MQTVKYEGVVPKSLKSYCDKHTEKIQEVSAGGGYTTESGFAYDISLRDGWRVRGDICHTIIEPTVADTLSVLRRIVPCDCENCHRK